MVWIKRIFKSKAVGLLSCVFFLVACSISYKFNGASIDYTKTKTIQISAFPIRSAYVWAPMQSIFSNQLTDVFARQTKLRQVTVGDLQLSGEIVEYSQFTSRLCRRVFVCQMQLKMTVNVRFVNNANHNEDFEQKFSATSQYDSSQQLTAVQEELVTQMVKDIVDQIFNATVANW